MADDEFLESHPAINRLYIKQTHTICQLWLNFGPTSATLAQNWARVVKTCTASRAYLSSRALNELSLWDSCQIGRRSLLSYSIAIAGFQPLQVLIDQELVRVVATRSCYGGRTTLKSRFTHILKRYHYVILLKHSTLWKFLLLWMSQGR